MGIDIYRKGDRKTNLFSINDRLYELLDAGIINEFEKKTGVLIDNYGFSKLSVGHSQTLLNFIKSYVKNVKTQVDKNILQSFAVFLEEMISQSLELELIGD